MLLILLIGCNDRPTAIGTDLLLDTVHIAVLTSKDTTLFRTVETVQFPLALFNTGYLYVGASQSAIAWTLLRPTLFPPNVDSIAEDQIQSAHLILFPRRLALGDTVSNLLRFSLAEIQQLWRPGTTVDTLRQFLQSGNFLGPTIAQFDQPIPLQDSTEPIRIPIPKSMIARWLAIAADTTRKDSARIFGVALIPDTIESTVIRSFYTQSPGHTELPLSYYEVVVQRADSLDTLRIENGYDLSVLFIRQLPPAHRLFVQGGIAQRLYIAFDPSPLPPLSIVHKATLVLPYDSTLFERTNHSELPALTTYIAADTALGAIGEQFPLSNGEFRLDSGVVVFPNIGAAFELWRSKRPKSAIVITVGDEFGRIDRLAFYKPTDPQRQPYLELIYSAMPQEKRK